MKSGFDSDAGSAERALLSVAELNRAVAGLLARGFPLVRVRGEVANFSRAASGHWYFTLKDAAAQVRCAMFRSRNVLAGFTPSDGQAVELLAQVGLYEARGEFQLTIESMRRAGQGALFERFLELKARLAAEGLFDSDRKRPVARWPRRIGIVTSLQAAALRDVLTALQRRAAHVGVIVYPAPVQGSGAAERIATALRAANQRGEVDTLLLVRGGGSIEDLWSFNEEAVARAIVASTIPVIVGVGHESDFTIADFAADLRAPTPTAAAELAAPDRVVLLARLDEQGSALQRCAETHLRRAQQHLDMVLRAFASPRLAVGALLGRVQALQRRVVHATQLAHARRQRQLGDACLRFGRIETVARAPRERVTQLLERLKRSTARTAEERVRRLLPLAARLHGLDPLAVLARGYAHVTDAAGHTVRDAATLQRGDRLRLQLARGRADARVDGVSPGGAGRSIP